MTTTNEQPDNLTQNEIIIQPPPPTQLTDDIIEEMPFYFAQWEGLIDYLGRKKSRVFLHARFSQLFNFDQSVIEQNTIYGSEALPRRFTGRLKLYENDRSTRIDPEKTFTRAIDFYFEYMVYASKNHKPDDIIAPRVMFAQLYPLDQEMYSRIVTHLENRP